MTSSVRGRTTLREPLLDNDYVDSNYMMNMSGVHSQSNLNASIIDQTKAGVDRKDNENEFPFIDDEETIPNNTKKCIDFDAQLAALKKRTEQQMPYTLTQVEDAMYIDQYNVITLEYFYYHNNCKYSYLKPHEEHIDQNNDLVDSDGNKVSYLLGTEKYLYDTDKINPMNSFERENLINYSDTRQDFLLQQKNSKNRDFMTVHKADWLTQLGLQEQGGCQGGKDCHASSQPNMDDQIVEGIIALYKVTPMGGMQRTSQVELKMGKKFLSVGQGNMILTRSKDKKIISVTNFDKDDPDHNYFKTLAWTSKLKPFAPGDEFESLNKGMSAYYQNNKDSFIELIEVSFVGNSKQVQLIYLEAKERDLEEKQFYEQEIQDLKNKYQINGQAEAQSPKKQKKDLYSYEKREQPRKARKYVFFEVATGKVVLEYGGVQKPMKATNGNGREIEIYELGCLVKEIREEAFDPQIVFFFAGDFMDQQIKEQQAIFQWAMNCQAIGMQEIFGLSTQQDKIELIHHSIRQVVQSNTLDGYLNYFPFNQEWILSQKFNWEANIIVSTNRRFDQIALLNTPIEPDEFSTSTYYVHGNKFKEMLRIQNLKACNYICDVPYFHKLPKDTLIRHSRNSSIKDQLYYDIIKGQEAKTICLRLDHAESKQKVRSPKISIQKFQSQHDIWLHFKKNSKTNQIDEIFQTIHVSSGNQEGILQTQLPKSLSPGEDPENIIERRTSSFIQHQANLPCLAYNLGDSKIVLQNTLQVDFKRKYILKLQPGERFVNFVEFNSFEDIGFFPKGLRVECCSSFAFLTTGAGAESGTIERNRINLLLVDPFYESTQVAHFKSNTYYDNEIFLKTDTMVKTVVQSTIGRKGDSRYKTYLWTQFPAGLVRSKMLLASTNKMYEVIDSDDTIASDREDSDDGTTSSPVTYEQVLLTLSDRGFVYYVCKQNGKCEIMEGLPRDPYLQNHASIYSIKAEKCLAFTMQDCDTFYFMDEQYIVNELVRNENNRHLTLRREFSMKEMQRLDFKPRPFDGLILTARYAIQGPTIFYLYDISEQPYPEGIFEAEKIIKDDPTKSKSGFIHGPVQVKASQRFYNVYQVDKFASHITLVLKPDSAHKVILNDHSDWLDMSSFLDDGKVLVKIRRRFMVFSRDGAFIDEVTFSDFDNEEQEEDVEGTRVTGMTLKKFREQQLQMKQFEHEMSPIDKLRVRRRNDPVLDYYGHPYKFQIPDPPPPLGALNKMELLNMSRNNRWFLFFNRKTLGLLVYELRQRSKGNQDESFMQDDKLHSGSSGVCQFVPVYQADYDRTSMFQHIYTLKVDPIAYFSNHRSQIKIDDHGSVRLCYVENLPCIDKQIASNASEGDADDVEMVQCRLIGAIFSPVPGQMMMSSKCFAHLFDFPKDAQVGLQAVFDAKKAAVDRKANSIRLVQSRLPKKLFDYTQYENLIEELLELESQQADYVYAKIYYDNLLVVYCGRYVKYGRLVPNKKKARKPSKEMMDLVLEKVGDEVLQDVRLHFSEGLEILNLLETVNRNWLQLTTFDHKNNIYSVLTWDFDQNMEQGILQVNPDPNDDVKYQILKGMNPKMNYLLNQHHLVDLEYNIPLRQTHINQALDPHRSSYRKQLTMMRDFFNQRKVSHDGARFLGVEKACNLYYPLSRMDLLLWQNIMEAGANPALVNSSCSLEQLNIVVDGSSMFHYFADNSEFIASMAQRYRQEKANGTLSPADHTLPLQILNPNNRGETALHLAITSQSRQAFECMILMLVDFPALCLSKMMLNCVSMILSHESPQILEFFEENTFQTPQMRIEQFVPWADGMEEFIFASHTSLISKELLAEKLSEKGIACEAPTKAAPGPGIGGDKSATEFSERQQIARFKRKLRPLDLAQGLEETNDEGGQELKRVQIEALDMDWIFNGDNANMLLEALANDANSAVLTKKSVRIFIDLMWAEYQGAIIKHIFVPYVVYLCALSQLAGYVSGEFILSLYPDEDGNIDTAASQTLKTKAYVLVNVSLTLMICFGSLEVQQMFASGLQYFDDPWNCVDAASLGLNGTFLLLSAVDIVNENEYFDVELIRSFGSFACFFMWIKVFYWMRLFSALAYYVKLIQQTIADSMNFMLMVAIIIFSFANFFYVIDRNLQNTSDSARYYQQYTGTDVVDVLISVYMMGALGDFESAIYETGWDRYFATGMFLLATFFICVVFMNMLIAIMSETFAQVTEEAVESGLQEQVVLIADFAWLIDLRKVFKGQKYIIRVQPSTASQQSHDVVVGKVGEVESSLNKSVQRLQCALQKRIDGVDVHTRFLMKYQQNAIEKVSKRLKQVEKMVKTALNKEEDEEELQGLPEDERLEKLQQKKRKGEILRALNAQTTGQTLTIDKVQEIALNWMELADKDGNGELDFGEFYDFFSKIEGIMVTQEEIRQIFTDFDGSGNGFLSVEEFARAIYQVVLADMDDYSEDEYGTQESLSIA